MRRRRRLAADDGDGSASTGEDEVVEDADFEVIDDETATKA